jgi:hypothetical protein
VGPHAEEPRQRVRPKAGPMTGSARRSKHGLQVRAAPSFETRAAGGKAENIGSI